MGKYKILANRQLSEYSGGDKYINITRNEELSEIFSLIESHEIITINREGIRIEEKGSTTNQHFIIEDKLLNKKYEVFFALGSRELRLQLTNYVNQEKIIPGDIITLILKKEGNNYNIIIKSDRIYKYVLEKKSKQINKYRILIDNPKSTGNCGITTTEFTQDYLSQFNIIAQAERMTFGKQGKIPIEFDVYTSVDCEKDYIGIPYDTSLKLDCFDNIEEIIK